MEVILLEALKRALTASDEAEWRGVKQWLNQLTPLERNQARTVLAALLDEL